MITVKVDSISKAVNAIEQGIMKSAEKAIKEEYEKKLRPFYNEVQDEGGTVTITVKLNRQGQGDLSLKFENISEALKNLIIAAL